jgi:hypothetical protein
MVVNGNPNGNRWAVDWRGVDPNLWVYFRAGLATVEAHFAETKGGQNAGRFWMLNIAGRLFCKMFSKTAASYLRGFAQKRDHK